MIYLLGNVGEWRNEANARNATSRAETESKLMPGNKSSYSIQNLICIGKKHYMCVYTFLTPAEIKNVGLLDYRTTKFENDANRPSCYIKMLYIFKF